MDYSEKIAESKRLFKDAKQRFAEGDAEAKAHIPDMISEAQRLKGEAEQEMEIEEALLETAALEKKVKTQAGGHPVAPNEFKSFVDFLIAVRKSKEPDRYGPWHPGLKWVDPEPADTKAMAEGVGATGGFLVPPDYRAEVLAVAAESSIVRPRARIIRMNSRTVQFPVLDQTNTTAGVSPFFGGFQVFWTEEATAKDENTPTFRQITLTAHELSAISYLSDSLLADSAVSLADFMNSEYGMPGVIAWTEDDVFLNGTGAGQPQGVIGAGCTIAEPRNVANQFSFDDAADMLQDFLPRRNGVWVISQSLMSMVIQMAGPTGNASYVWIANGRDGIPANMLGYPIIWSEKPPVRGTTGDVGLYNFKHYLIGDRQQTLIDTSIHARYIYNQTTWRCVHRVDGQPGLSAPLTLKDGTTQVSPFVVLSSTATGS